MNGKPVNYVDLSSREALEQSAIDMILGKRFCDIAEEYITDSGLADKLLKTSSHKGKLGDIVQASLGLKIDNEQAPDFKELGVELKVTPIEKGKRKPWKAGERLVITMISYDPKENEINGVPVCFEDSHVFEKTRCILLCMYIRPVKHKNDIPINYTVDKIQLFTIPREDLPIIENDWNVIMDKVRSGSAHELSDGLTNYLGACPKGNGNIKKQGYWPYAEAKPRAFCLKQSYMTVLLNNYIMQDRETYIRAEKIGGDFKKVALQRLNRWKGKPDYEIAEQLKVACFEGKQGHSNLSFSMLGLSSNSCEEFLKANIVMKTIRFEQSGALKESLSFPNFDIESITDIECFEDSELCEYFESTQFLLSIWDKRVDKNGKEYCVFREAGFWSMPATDIYGGEGTLEDCWTRTKKIIEEGIKLTPVYKDGKYHRMLNNLPGMNDEGSIAHVRPHTRLSYYMINGVEYKQKEESSKKYAFKLPCGDWMTKQSFWLNHKYVCEIVDKIRQ